MNKNDNEINRTATKARRRTLIALGCLSAITLMTGCGADGPAASEFLGPIGDILDLLGL